MRPLLVYVADRNMAEAVGGLLDRGGFHRAVGCAPFAFDSRQDVKVANGQNDPGIYTRGGELLRPFRADYERAVIIADEEWEGSPGANAMRSVLRGHLDTAGWAGDAGLPLVVSPEADVWLWSDSPHSATALGWTSWTELRPALENQSLLEVGQQKPRRPKEAAEWALASKRLSRAAWRYREVASQVSVRRCEDPALLAFLDQLRAWFPPEGA